MRKQLNIAIAAVAIFAACSSSWAEAKGPLKVFILAGQSNMEGKATVGTLDAVIGRPDTHDQFKHLKPDGKWLVRDDVWVTFLDRKGPDGSCNYGPLSVGFGSFKPNKKDRQHPHKAIGPELGIGEALGDHCKEPVLLIKAAWGGKSVKHNFLPPSAMPSEADIKAKYAEVKKNYESKVERYNKIKAGEIEGKLKNPGTLTSYEDYKESIGKFYRKILEEYSKVMSDRRY
jgi:hypothetical protein